MGESVETLAAVYFSSLSFLSKSIISECEAIKTKYGSGWSDIPPEKQDELLNDCFIDPTLAAKYETKLSIGESLPDCFPVLKINSGEKIVVDFEHDEHGWTWRDEHSGPFSWKTKSQQDLTFDELFSDNGLQPISVKRKSASKTTSVKSNVVGGSEAKNEVEEMFKKFGIKKIEEDKFDKTNPAKESCFGPENLGFVDLENELAKESSTDPMIVVSSGHSFSEKAKLLDGSKCDRTSSPAVNDEIKNKGVDIKNGSIKKKVVAASRKKQSDAKEAGSERVSHRNINSSLVDEKKVNENKLGNLNKVFFDHDIGESSTDTPVVICSEGDVGTGSFSNELEQPNSSATISSSSPVVKKTGFDFLDNW